MGTILATKYIPWEIWETSYDLIIIINYDYHSMELAQRNIFLTYLYVPKRKESSFVIPQESVSPNPLGLREKGSCSGRKWPHFSSFSSQNLCIAILPGKM